MHVENKVYISVPWKSPNLTTAAMPDLDRYCRSYNFIRDSAASGHYLHSLAPFVRMRRDTNTSFGYNSTDEWTAETPLEMVSSVKDYVQLNL
jgi:hypothetical protein